MKKLILLFVVLVASYATYAQDYKPFRVGLGLGYASPAGAGAKAGVLFYLEPSYRVTDAIAVGLKAEAAIMFRATNYVQNGQNYAGSGSVAAAGSYTVNGIYYFTNSGFRPYAGLGAGIYSLASASVSFAGNGNSQTSNQSQTVSGGSKVGFYPRIGFDAGHFTLNIEYNIIPTSKGTVLVTSSNGTVSAAPSETKNNYLGVRVGFFIGGGKK